MSVVVVGGNDRMATRYKDICKSYNCKAKVFTQMPSDFENTRSDGSFHKHLFTQDGKQR